MVWWWWCFLFVFVFVDVVVVVVAAGGGGWLIDEQEGKRVINVKDHIILTIWLTDRLTGWLIGGLIDWGDRWQMGMMTITISMAMAMVMMSFIYNNLSNIKYSLTYWGRDKMAAFSQTTLSNAFSWMKILEFRLKIHWGFFLGVLLTIFQY